MRRAHGPDQTTRLPGTPITVSTRSRWPTAMTRSLLSRLPNVSQHDHGTCVNPCGIPKQGLTTLVAAIMAWAQRFFQVRLDKFDPWTIDNVAKVLEDVVL